MTAVAALIGLSVAFAVYAIGRTLGTRNQALHQRLDALVAMHMDAPPHVTDGGGRRHRSFLHFSNTSGFAARKARMLTRLDTQLRRADMSIGARDFATRWALVVACFGIVLMVGFGWLAFVMVWMIAGMGTYFYLQNRVNARIRRFHDGLHDALVMISNSLRAGHSFGQCLHVVSQEMQGPIQEEFSRIESEMQLGIGIEEALERGVTRIGSEDFELIVTAIQIQRQLGGNLAEVLDRIADTIRDRVKIKREVKALTAQGRLSGLIFMCMPAGIGGIVFLMNPSYISILFQSPIGIAMLVFAAISQVIGLAIIRKIVNVTL